MKDEIIALSDRLDELKPHCTTEEATKNALIMPFISALGYNVFNPLEVVPEFTADIGIKQGEKVDYAIMGEGTPLILIECKAATHELGEHHTSQLYRYFTATRARFGILTNGIQYKIYTDLDQPNVMDQKPFLEIDLENTNDRLLDELKRFTKTDFNIDEILSTASELKYGKAIRRILQSEWANPSDEFIRFFSKQVYSGKMTQNTLSTFQPIVKSAFQVFVNEVISKRLKIAMTEEIPTTPSAQLNSNESIKQPQESDLRFRTTVHSGTQIHETCGQAPKDSP